VGDNYTVRPTGYVTETSIGLFCLPPVVSHYIHLVAAVGGFGLMTVWVMFYFTKSTFKKGEWTRRKTIRNRIYNSCGTMMFSGLIMILLGMVLNWQYVVFIGEEIILIPAGFAILVKDGLILKDK